MAVEAKRAKLLEYSNDDIDENDPKLDNFVAWLASKNVKICEKVNVSKRGSCAQYGLIARCDVDEGDCLFEVPRSAILWQENNGIEDRLIEEIKCLKSESGWVPLIVVLLHEYLNPDSGWRPYLDILPDKTELHQPMFWDREEMLQELRGTGVISAVQQDLVKMRLEYNTVVEPFLKTHPEQFSLEVVTFDLYMKLVAFVMAYSFTDPISIVAMVPGKADGEERQNLESNPPMMVPLADTLNHVAKNNAQLSFGKSSLKMCAVKPIKKGEEIFNTYGELSNAELLHMYGFAELHPRNHYDLVEIPCSSVLEMYKKMSEVDEKDLLQNKLDFLKNSELVTDDGHFAIGHDGVLTEDELHHTLKVLFMDRDAFNVHKEKDGWSDDDSSNEDDDIMSNETLNALPPLWKEFLKKVAAAHLAGYSILLVEDIATLRDAEKMDQLTRRRQWALYVRYGQGMILTKFIECLDR